MLPEDREDWERIAYGQGAAAARRVESILRNPYYQGHFQHEWWDRGYREAKQEMTLACRHISRLREAPDGCEICDR